MFCRSLAERTSSKSIVGRIRLREHPWSGDDGGGDDDDGGRAYHQPFSTPQFLPSG